MKSVTFYQAIKTIKFVFATDLEEEKLSGKYNMW